MGTTDTEPAARYTLEFANTELGAISFTDAFRLPAFAFAPVEVSLVEPEALPDPVPLASIELAVADVVPIDVVPDEVTAVEVRPVVDVAPVEAVRVQEHFSDEAPPSDEPQEAIMVSETEPAVEPWLVMDNPDTTHGHEVIALVAQAESDLRDAQAELERAESAALTATEREVDLRRRVEKTEFDVQQQGDVLDNQTEELLRARAVVLDKELEVRRFELSEREQMELAVAAQRRAQAEEDARRIAEEARAAAAAAEARVPEVARVAAEREAADARDAHQRFLDDLAAAERARDDDLKATRAASEREADVARSAVLERVAAERLELEAVLEARAAAEQALEAATGAADAASIVVAERRASLAQYAAAEAERLAAEAREAARRAEEEAKEALRRAQELTDAARRRSEQAQAALNEAKAAQDVPAADVVDLTTPHDRAAD
jgi:hypothetical protein